MKLRACRQKARGSVAQSENTVVILWLYLIIADAVPAAALTGQSLQILDPELRNKAEVSDEPHGRTPDHVDGTAPYLHVHAVLEAALGLRLHQPVAVLRKVM